MRYPPIVALFLTILALPVFAGPADDPVALSQNASTFTLANGIIRVTIEKRSGDVAGIQYHNLQLLGVGEGRSNGYWSLPGTAMSFGSQHVASVVLDPSTNGGERAIVSIAFTYNNQADTAPADVDLRYSLARGDSALYLQADWRHKANYPLLTFPVGRFAAKLNPKVFDYLAVDSNRQRIMPTASDWGSGVAQNMKEARLLTTGQFAGQVEHKYDYSAVQFDTPAYGWASTTDHVGLWMVTPSNEYMSGGCTKLELNAHLDGNQSGFPTLLNVWKGPHYGGTVISIPQGQDWTKCVGPFLLYCNSAASGKAMFADANVRAAADAKSWPYPWVNDDAYYTPRDQRGSVKGHLKLNDPLVSQSQISDWRIGLTAPNVDWQRDGQNYQFWVRGGADGQFTIPNVRPGLYTLHAFATGVLGEYLQTDIKVESGRPVDLGQLDWKPIRYGRPLWEIGVPDRTAGEFLHGDHYWQWGIYNQYPTDFPNDVHYVIGKGDYHKDWNLMQVPRARDASGKGRGDATTWTVAFSLPAAPKGKATLRLALAGTEARSLAIAMNDKPVATLTDFPNTSVIHRDSDRGYWTQRVVPFDAALMQAGDNTLKLTVPAGPVTAGIEYDYLRLELDESEPAPPPGGENAK